MGNLSNENEISQYTVMVEQIVGIVGAYAEI